MDEPRIVTIDGHSCVLTKNKRGWSMLPADEDNARLDAVMAAWVASWHNKAHTSDPMEKEYGIDNERRFGAH